MNHDVQALALACFVWNVEQGQVLAVNFTDEGGLVAVIDLGIAGAPKYRLTPEQVLAERGKRYAAVSDELRGTFGSDGIAHGAGLTEDGEDTPNAVSALDESGTFTGVEYVDVKQAVQKSKGKSKSKKGV